MTVLAQRPTLRLLPAPAIDPPYDDELAASSHVDGNLALEFPVDLPCHVPLRLVPPAAPAPRDGDGVDPAPLVRRIAQAIVEVLAGARTAGQLSAYATLDVLEHLERAAGRMLGARRGAPNRRPIVESVHVSRPSATAAEACAVIDTGSRRRAIALRLELIDAHWRCTVLQIC